MDVQPDEQFAFQRSYW